MNMLKFFNNNPKNQDGRIPRPAVLKGLHMKQTRIELLTAIVLAGCGMLCYYTLTLKKKENYLHFYKYGVSVKEIKKFYLNKFFYRNFDREEAFERMRKVGLLQCSNFKNYE